MNTIMHISFITEPGANIWPYFVYVKIYIDRPERNKKTKYNSFIISERKILNKKNIVTNNEVIPPPLQTSI